MTRPRYLPDFFVTTRVQARVTTNFERVIAGRVENNFFGYNDV